MNRPEPHDQRVANLIDAFEREFGRRPEGIAEAPGRVNLIGEHTDYNDGLVLPFAIDRSVMCAWGTEPESIARRRLRGAASTILDHGARALIVVQSLEDESGTVFGVPLPFPPEIREPDYDAHGMIDPGSGRWTDYVQGVAFALQQLGARLDSACITFEGNVPQGAGLSSSAALEVAIAGAFRDAFDFPIDDVALAKLCQRAENEYVGVQCGIMDQFASALSKKDHALLIDCRTLAYEHIPLRLEAADVSAVIVNSGVKRELASSAYNDRRRECEDAVAILRGRLGRPDLTSLRDVTAADLDLVDIDTTPLRRARHVVSEIARVAACVDALRTDDFAAVGELMLQSHISLRDDFEVSSQQLDLLVALATAQDYVLGARLTGAGFGGCTINLVRADAIDRFERDIVDIYRQRTGLPAETYLTSPQAGLRTWRL